MNPAPDTPAPRRRARKLWLVLAMFGIVMAAFVGILFVPGGGVDDSQKVGAIQFATNDASEITASLLITNTRKSAIQLLSLETQEYTNGQLSAFRHAGTPQFRLAPQESGRAPVEVPRHGQSWRVQWRWYVEPTRFQTFRFRVRARMNSIVPGLGGDLSQWLGPFMHTNHSAEFPR